MFEMKCETPAHEIFGTKIEKSEIFCNFQKSIISLHSL